MGVTKDPGYDRVTERTRAFARIDEQVFRGAGRGPTPAESEAAEHAPPVTERACTTRDRASARRWR